MPWPGDTPDEGDIAILAAIDTDAAMAANSDARVASQKATKTHVAAAIAALVDASPATLDTLNELAAALGDDANFAATVTAALAGKQPLDSDLTAIAALTTTAFGRSLLSLAAFTAGSVIFAGAGGTPSEDNANFFWDDTNNKLRIGAAPPALAALTISGLSSLPTANFDSGLLTVRSTTAAAVNVGASIHFGGNTGNTVPVYPFASVLGAKESAVADNYSGYYAVYTVNAGGALAERFRISGAGNVGIGTTNPASKLEVVNAAGGFAAENYFQITGSVADNLNYPGLRFRGGTLATSYPTLALTNGGYGLRFQGGSSAGVPNTAFIDADSAGTIKLGFGSNNDFIVNSNATTTQRTRTVAQLPAAGTAGRRAFVTDANATTFASVVAAGGANAVPVYDDGTNWRIG